MENVEELSLMQSQIERLRAEITSLQQSERDKVAQFRGRMQDALLLVCGGTAAGGGGEEEVLSRLREEVQELERDLKSQTELNGINLSSCSTKTLQHGGGVLVQQFCITGRCSELNFQVEFQLSELKEDQRCERKITDLNVVMDSSDLQDFSSFLCGVEESRDLLLLFRTLRTFSERCDDRRRTFQHFQDKYPAVVSLPGGCRSEVMTLHPPQLPGCVLLVHWSVLVSKEGGVTSETELLSRIPERALQMDSSQTVGGAAEAFQSLQRILGTEAALESLIQAVST